MKTDQDLIFEAYMENNNTQDKVTVSEIIMAVDAIARAVRDEKGKVHVIAALSYRFNPEMVSTIGTVNDNYQDAHEKKQQETRERM